MNCRFNAKVAATVLFLVLANLVYVESVGAVVWSTEMRLTLDTSNDRAPTLMRASDGKIWVFWHRDIASSNNTELYYKVYDPSQLHPWSSDTRLTYSTVTDQNPYAMQAADGRIWVVWVSGGFGNYSVYRKIYNGTSWTANTKLPILTEPYRPHFPSIVQAINGTIIIFYSAQKGVPERDIYYISSQNNGASWSNETLLTAASSPPPRDDWDPAATVTSDGSIFLTWTRDDDIYSTFYNGATWSSPQTVYASALPDWRSSVVQAADGQVWAVFDRTDNTLTGVGDVYYNIWDGTRWTGAVQLTTDPSDDDMPSITRAADGSLWVAWDSNRPDTYYDIYYKKSSASPQHDLAVFSVTPETTVVSQNRSVAVDIVTQNLGSSTELFNITLYANSTQVGSKNGISITSGQLSAATINWSTVGFSLGNYTVTANITVVAGDANPADNTYVDGTITVVMHDVAVTSITPSFTQGYQGYTNGFIYVGIRNEGTIREAVTVTLYRNSTLLGIQTDYLDPGENSTLTFMFFTAGVPYGNYRIIAQATPMPDEVDFANNNLTHDFVKVTIPGDVNGDGKVDVFDLFLISAHWTDPPEGPLGYETIIDINADAWIDIYDIEITSIYWSLEW